MVRAWIDRLLGRFRAPAPPTIAARDFDEARKKRILAEWAALQRRS